MRPYNSSWNAAPRAERESDVHELASLLPDQFAGVADALGDRAQPLQRLVRTVAGLDMSLPSESALHDVFKAMWHVKERVDKPDKANIDWILSSGYDALFERVLKVAAVANVLPEHVVTDLLARSKSFAAVEEKLAKSMNDHVDSSYGAFRDEMKAMVDKAESAQTAAEKAAEVAGVTKEKKLFEAMATRHGASAKNWLIGTAVAAAAAACLMVYLFSPVLWTEGGEATLHASISWGAIAARVIVATFVLSIVAFCGRNYRSERHNEIVNTHRQTALQTMESFSLAVAGNEEIKAAVIQRVVDAVFGNRPTGYVGGADSAPALLPGTIADRAPRRAGDRE